MQDESAQLILIDKDKFGIAFEKTLKKLKVGRQSTAGKAISAFVKELELLIPENITGNQWCVGDKVSVKMSSGVVIPEIEIRSIQHKYKICKVYDSSTGSHFTVPLTDLAPPIKS